QFDVEQRQAEVKQLKAQLESARWNLDKTVVRAPADGYVTNIALRKGARVSSTAGAGDGVHRHIGDNARCRDRANLCALYRTRTTSRGHVQVSPGTDLHRP